MALNAVGEGLWGLGSSLVLPAIVLAILLREHGAGEVMISSMASIEMGGIALFQLLGPYIMTSRRKRKRNLLLWHTLLPIPFWALIGVIVLLAPRLGNTATRWGLLTCYTGHIISIGIIVAIWTDWIAHLFDVKIRGRAYGLAICASSLCGSISLSLAGLMVRRFGQAAFPFLYWGAAVLGIISMLVFWYVKDPAEEEEEQSLHIGFGTMMARFRDSLRSPNFRSFLFGRLLATTGFSFVPILAVHFMSANGGGLNQSSIVSYGVALPLGLGVASLITGRLGDAKGHKPGMLMGIGMQVVTLGVLLSGSGAGNCMLVYTCTGMAMGLGIASHFNMLFETCPHDSRLAHITIGNLVCSVGTVAAPMAAGWVASVWGYRTLFSCSLVLSIVALAWFMLCVKDPRHLPMQP